MGTNDFRVVNIKESLDNGKIGEEYLHNLFDRFDCPINPDVKRFLCQQSIDFAKRNQSVTYLVFTVDDELVAYFTITIKPISVNAKGFSNSHCAKGATYQVFQSACAD